MIDSDDNLVHLHLEYEDKQGLQTHLIPLLKELHSQSSHSPLLVDATVIDEIFDQKDEDEISLFLQCLCDAPSVIIARMRKDQKQAITHALKEFGRKEGKTIHVLCVGDGANDIGMIRESDVGIGIKGKEGLQAFNNADVSLPSFQSMTKLLFVHGKANEIRLQTLVLYFLYKNTLLSILTLLLSYLAMFSGLKVLPSWGVDFFNT